MKRERRAFAPEKGVTYDNHGGGTFQCVGEARRTNLWGWCADFMNVKSGWKFEARGIHRYPDGRIDWDYSVMGRFVYKEAIHEEKV